VNAVLVGLEPICFSEAGNHYARLVTAGHQVVVNEFAVLVSSRQKLLLDLVVVDLVGSSEHTA